MGQENNPDNQSKPSEGSKNVISANILLITGGRGAGKTTYCLELCRQARQMGLSTGGFLTPGVFENGRKIAFELLNLLTDERRDFGCYQVDQATVGVWLLDETVAQWGNQILLDSRRADVVFIDELGPLEFEMGGGFQRALKLLDQRAFAYVFVVVRPELLEAAQARWPEAVVEEVGGQI